MSDDPQDEALESEISQLLQKFLVLAGLMASATRTVEQIYRSRIQDLKRRTDAVIEKVNKLSEDQRLKWGLSHLERINEEVASLIKEMRAKID